MTMSVKGSSAPTTIEGGPHVIGIEIKKSGFLGRKCTLSTKMSDKSTVTVGTKMSISKANEAALSIVNETRTTGVSKPRIGNVIKSFKNLSAAVKDYNTEISNNNIKRSGNTSLDKNETDIKSSTNKNSEGAIAESRGSEKTEEKQVNNEKIKEERENNVLGRFNETSTKFSAEDKDGAILFRDKSSGEEIKLNHNEYFKILSKIERDPEAVGDDLSKIIQKKADQAEAAEKAAAAKKLEPSNLKRPPPKINQQVKTAAAVTTTTTNALNEQAKTDQKPTYDPNTPENKERVQKLRDKKTEMYEARLQTMYEQHESPLISDPATTDAKKTSTGETKELSGFKTHVKFEIKDNTIMMSINNGRPAKTYKVTPEFMQQCKDNEGLKSFDELVNKLIVEKNKQQFIKL